MFQTFFEKGFYHIVDIGALDHILFLLVTVSIYNHKNYKTIFWVVTSFTLAHTISLALAVFNVINLPRSITELLIACTILFTAVENLFIPRWYGHRVWLTGAFGLIHGLGFSGVLRGIFMGTEMNWLQTLLPFNLGVEAGQLIIMTVLLTFIFLLQATLKLEKKMVIQLFSIPVLLISLYWIIIRLPE